MYENKMKKCTKTFLFFKFSRSDTQNNQSVQIREHHPTGSPRLLPFLLLLQKCWPEDGASPCVLIETPHKELEPADPSCFKQYQFKNLFIKASPIPRLRSVLA